MYPACSQRVDGSIFGLGPHCVACFIQCSGHRDAISYTTMYHIRRRRPLHQVPRRHVRHDGAVRALLSGFWTVLRGAQGFNGQVRNTVHVCLLVGACVWGGVNLPV